MPQAAADTEVPVRPADVAGVADAVRAAEADGRPLQPVGGGTALDYGSPFAGEAVRLDTTGLAGIVDYPYDDMTVTVRAGTRWADVAAALAERSQWVPIDVADPRQATVGGLVATDWTGPLRHGYGTWRDYILGITVVGSGGHMVRGGGRVVKNVAGYDLPKLHVGALGTLGVIAEVTLKTVPRPPSVARVRIAVDDQPLGPALDTVAASLWQPVAVEYTGRPHAATVDISDGGTAGGVEEVQPLPAPHLGLEFHGPAGATDWQVRQVRTTWPDAEVVARLPQPDPADCGAGVACVRLFVRPLRVARAVRSFGGLGGEVAIHGRAGVGDLFVVGDAARLWKAAGDAVADFAEAAVFVSGRTETIGGFILRRPAADAAEDVRRRLQTALDPHGVFNRGRFRP